MAKCNLCNNNCAVIGNTCEMCIIHFKKLNQKIKKITNKKEIYFNKKDIKKIKY